MRLLTSSPTRAAADMAGLTLRRAAANFAAVERQQNIFSQVANTPAVQAVLRRVEQGGALSLDGVNVAAQSFVVALLHECFPKRTLVAVTAGVKAQESFHQDLATWSAVEGCRLKVAGWSSRRAGLVAWQRSAALRN